MTFKVVNTIHLPDVDFGESLLEPLDAETINAFVQTEEDLIESCVDADAIICSGPVQPWTGRVIDTLSRCRIIASLAIGYDRIDLAHATDHGIVVTNIPDFCVDEVSTQAVALILALNRQLFFVDKEVREKQVRIVPPNREVVRTIPYPVLRLRDTTVGIVGLGRIGTAVALKAKGLGMKVTAYDPYVLDAVILSRGFTPVSFETLLRESDFISIHAALTDETFHMFDDRTFKMMKPTCCLINTARGEIVDQAALARAVQERRIAGAGLDATEQEPVPEDDPVLSLPNVILTGHSAWYSTSSYTGPEFWHRAMTQVVLALQGKWPPYAVNPEVKPTWLGKWGGSQKNDGAGKKGGRV